MTPADVLARHTGHKGTTMEPDGRDLTRMRPVEWCNECEGFIHWPCDAVLMAQALARVSEAISDMPRLWWCPAWGTLNAVRYHGLDGPDDPNCGLVSYLRPDDVLDVLDRALAAREPEATK